MKDFAEKWPEALRLYNRPGGSVTIKIIQEQLGVTKSAAWIYKVALDNKGVISGRKNRNYGRRHIVIPDSQITPDCPWDFLRWIGEYIADKRPNVIVHLGDFADIPSLSSYDKGKGSHAGKRYQHDVEAANAAFSMMCEPFERIKGYTPEKYITLGNHENRINRAVEFDSVRLEGLMSVDDLLYSKHGFKVVPFLQPVFIDGVAYCHYFYNRQSGRPYAGENISLKMKNIGFSFCQGHQQVYQIGTRELNNGKRIRGIVQGACYLHSEDYRGPQAANEPRGILMLTEVCEGDYCLTEVSLPYLCKKYEGMDINQFMLEKYPGVDTPYKETG